MGLQTQLVSHVQGTGAEWWPFVNCWTLKLEKSSSLKLAQQIHNF